MENRGVEINPSNHPRSVTEEVRFVELLFNFEGLFGLLEINTFLYGGIAQLGEHLLCKQGVNGSNPFISTKGKVKRTGKPENNKWAYSSAG